MAAAAAAAGRPRDPSCPPHAGSPDVVQRENGTFRNGLGEVQARMRGFGETEMAQYEQLGVAAEDYLRCFEAKWQVIAAALGLHYSQHRQAAGPPSS